MTFRMLRLQSEVGAACANGKVYYNRRPDSTSRRRQATAAQVRILCVRSARREGSLRASQLEQVPVSYQDSFVRPL